MFAALFPSGLGRSLLQTMDRRQQGASNPAPSTYARLVDVALRYLSLVVSLLATLKEILSNVVGGSSTSPPKYLKASAKTSSPDTPQPPLSVQSKQIYNGMQLCDTAVSLSDLQVAADLRSASEDSCVDDEKFVDAEHAREFCREPSTCPTYLPGDASASECLDVGCGSAVCSGGSYRSPKPRCADDSQSGPKATAGGSECDDSATNTVAADCLFQCWRCVKSNANGQFPRSRCSHVPLASIAVIKAERASDAFRLSDDCLSLTLTGPQWNELVCGLVGKGGLIVKPLRQVHLSSSFRLAAALNLDCLSAHRSERLFALTLDKALERANDAAFDAVNPVPDWRPLFLPPDSTSDQRWQALASAVASMLHHRLTIPATGTDTTLDGTYRAEPSFARFADEFLAAEQEDRDTCHDVAGVSLPPRPLPTALGLLCSGCSTESVFAKCSTIMWAYAISAENSPTEAVELLLGRHHDHHSNYHRALSLPLDSHGCRASTEGERSAIARFSSPAVAAALPSGAALGSCPLRSPLHRLPSPLERPASDTGSAASVASTPTEQRRSSNSNNNRGRRTRSAGTTVRMPSAACAGSGSCHRPQPQAHPLRPAVLPTAEQPSSSERRCVSACLAAADTSANSCEASRARDPAAAGCASRTAASGATSAVTAAAADVTVLSAGAASTGDRPRGIEFGAVAKSGSPDVCDSVELPASEAVLCGIQQTSVDLPWRLVCADVAVSKGESYPTCSRRRRSCAAVTSVSLDGSASKPVALDVHQGIGATKVAASALIDTMGDAQLDGPIAPTTALPEPDLVLSGASCRPRPEPDVVPTAVATVAVLGSPCSREPSSSHEDFENDAFEALTDVSDVPARCRESAGVQSSLLEQQSSALLQQPTSPADDREKGGVPTGYVAARGGCPTPVDIVERKCDAGSRDLRRRSSARECVAHGSDLIDTSRAAVGLAAITNSNEASGDSRSHRGAVTADSPADYDHRPLIRQAGPVGNSATFPPTAAAAAGGRRRSLRSIFSTSSVLSVLSRLRRPPNQAQSAARSSEPSPASAADATAGCSYQGSLDRGTSFANGDRTVGSAGTSSRWSPRRDSSAAASSASQPAAVGSRFSALLKSRSFSDLRSRSRKNGLVTAASATAAAPASVDGDSDDRCADPASPRRDAASLTDKRRGKCKSLVLDRSLPAGGSRAAADDTATTNKTEDANCATVERSESSNNGEGSCTAAAAAAAAVCPTLDAHVPSSAPPSAAPAARRLPVNSHLLRSNRHSMPPLLPQSLSWHDLRRDDDGDASGSSSTSGGGGRPSAEQARRERSRRLAALTADELLLTERDYVAALRYVVEEYAAPEADMADVDVTDHWLSDYRTSESNALRNPRLHQEASEPQRVVATSAVAPASAASRDGHSRIVFGNIADICSFHCRRLLPELESCTAIDPFGVGACFLRHREEFLAYSAYIRNKPRSEALMQSLGMNLFKRKQHQLADPLDLSSYLLKPIQRLGKYALILRRLHKECVNADDGNDPAQDGRRRRDELAEAEEMVRFCLRHGNDLLALDTLCDRRGSPISTGLSSGVMSAAARLLLRQDELIVTYGGRSCRRRVFLFEHLLLFSKPRMLESGQEKYTFKLCLKMCNIGVTETIGSTGTQFEVWLHKRKKGGSSWVLQAPSADVKQSWVKDICGLLWNQAKQKRDQQVLRSPLKCVSLTDVTAARGAAQIELVTVVGSTKDVTHTVSERLYHSPVAIEHAVKSEPRSTAVQNTRDPAEVATTASAVRQDNDDDILLSVSKSACSSLCDQADRQSEPEGLSTLSYRSSSSSSNGGGSSSSSRTSIETLVTASVTASSVGSE